MAKYHFMVSKLWLKVGLIFLSVYTVLFITAIKLYIWGNPFFGFPQSFSECAMGQSDGGITFSGCPFSLEFENQLPVFIYGLIIYFCLGAILGLIYGKIKRHSS